MIITVNKNELLTKLIAVSKVTGESKIRPIISCVKLEAKDTIKLTATDLEMTITADVEGDIQIQGTAVFNPSKVIEYVSTLDNGNVTIEFCEGFLKIYEAEFEIMSADEYPAIKQSTLENEIEIDSNKLINVLSGCVTVSKTVSDNPSLSGVRVEISDKMHCIASDSFRMAYFEEDVKSDIETKITIPNNAVFRILDLLKNTEKVVLNLNSNNMQIKVDDYVFTSRLITMAFPNWKSIITGFTSDKTIMVNRVEAIKIMKRMIMFARENISCKNAVIFETDKNKVNLKAVGGTSRAKDKLDAIIEGDKIKINLNAQFIVDYLNTINCDAVEIKMNGSNNPVMIKPCDKYNTWFIGMPVALVE